MPDLITDPDLIELTTEERIDLAEFLATLTPEQWDHPSLCAEWTVRDVVAPMIGYEALSTPALVWRFIQGGLRLNRINAIGVKEGLGLTTDDLLAELNAHLTPTGLTTGFKGRIGLVDGLIHHQDIRRHWTRPPTARRRSTWRSPGARRIPRLPWRPCRTARR
jgi:uncharacterized protein (TIGR03083 family)